MYIKNNDAAHAGVRLEKIAQASESALIGNGEDLAYGFCPISDPKDNCIAFSTDRTSRRLLGKFQDEKPIAIFLDKDFEQPESIQTNIFLAEDPQKAMIKAIELFYTKASVVPGIHKSSNISKTAQIDSNVEISENVTIHDNVKIASNTYIGPNTTIAAFAEIGSNCLIHSNVSIREYSVLGNNIVIQNGTVIGSDGFGYLEDPYQGLMPVPQIGNVVLSDYVEVGANTCIDRATIGSTRIGTGSKIDNHVQIGHNVEIGEFSILCGQVGIAGSVKIGNQVVIGAKTGVADHVYICDQTRLAANSGVRQTISESGDYAGDPLIPVSDWKRNHAILRNLAKYVIPRKA